MEKLNSTDKQQQWDELSLRIEQFGKEDPIEIDEGIKDTLVALMGLGFTTTASCYGHLDKSSAFPWVRIDHPLVAETFSDPHYSELANRNTSEDEENQIPLTPEEREEYERGQEAMKAALKAEREKLSQLLEEFYSKREAQPGIQLTVSEFKNWLQSEETVKLDSDKVRSSKSPEEFELTLNEYRREMDAFTQFLKNRFFSTN